MEKSFFLRVTHFEPINLLMLLMIKDKQNIARFEKGKIFKHLKLVDFRRFYDVRVGKPILI
jgi:hypothetical protein